MPHRRLNPDLGGDSADHVGAELPQTDDILADLVAELRHLGAVITRPNGFSFVGTVLAEELLTPGLIAQFRERLVLPRRRRLAATLRRGMQTGVVRSDMDVDAVTGMLTDSVYAQHLAQGTLPVDWPKRVVGTIWPALRAT